MAPQLLRPPAAGRAKVAAHEPDLKDILLGLCKPRYVAAHKRELPPHPEGPLRTFTVPMGTTEIARDAYQGCTPFVESTLPPTIAQIGTWAFAGCLP